QPRMRLREPQARHLSEARSLEVEVYQQNLASAPGQVQPGVHQGRGAADPAAERVKRDDVQGMFLEAVTRPQSDTRFAQAFPPEAPLRRWLWHRHSRAPAEIVSLDCATPG